MSIVEFFSMLASFDWYYANSDSFSVWEAGNKAYAELRSITHQSLVHQRMYDDWREYMFSGEPWGTVRSPKPVLENYL
jgi:hypothetical protein